MAAPLTISGATSAEGQVLTLVRELIQAEDAWVAAGLALTPPVTRQRRFTLGLNLQAGTATVSGTLPITYADSADGLSIVADEYLP